MSEGRNSQTATIIVGGPVLVAVTKVLAELVDTRIQNGTSLWFDKPVPIDTLELLISAGIAAMMGPVFLAHRVYKVALAHWLQRKGLGEVLDEEGKP